MEITTLLIFIVIFLVNIALIFKPKVPILNLFIGFMSVILSVYYNNDISQWEMILFIFTGLIDISIGMKVSLKR